MPASNSSEMDSDTDYDTFCCCFESCCPKCIKLERKTDGLSSCKKYLLFTAFLAVISLSVALWLQITLLDSQKLVLGIDDQRLLETGVYDFSAMFCSRYELRPADSSSFHQSNRSERNLNIGLIGAYLLLDGPKESFRPRKYSRQYKFELSSPSEYAYWAYQMGNLNVLHIDLLCSSESNLTMYVLQEKDFFKWMTDLKNGGFCSSCLYQTYQFPCSTNATELQISDYEYSEYIFLFHERTLFPNSSLTAEVTFTLSRYPFSFDDNAVASQCKNVTDCRLTVPNAAKTILLQMEADSPSSSVTLTTRCTPKVEMYFAFFLAVPLGLLLVLATLIWLPGKCQEDVLRETQNADNARSMARLHTNPPPSYGDNHPRTSATSSSTSSSNPRPVIPIFSLGTPTQQRLPLIDYEVTSEESEHASVSGSPPEYGTINRVSIPQDNQRMESLLERYSTTPPPDYTHALSRAGRGGGNSTFLI